VFVLLLPVVGGCADAPEAGGAAAGDSIAAAAPGTDVFVAPLDSADDSLRIETPTAITTRPGYDNQPAFLRDGTGLVWTAVRDGQADVYRWTGTESTQLTDTPESEFSPTPRPDGMTVVRVDADGRQRLWRYSETGTPIEPVLSAADSVGYHAWLDSTRVALFELGTPPTLRVVDVTTGADTVVTRWVGRLLQSVPGRAAVSFGQVASDSTTAIHVIEGDVPTTGRLTVTPAEGTGDFHAWTPSGQLLMATTDALVAWSPPDGVWRTVAPLDTIDVSRLAVSPAGDRLAFVAAE
jgi:hypothetical protein